MASETFLASFGLIGLRLVELHGVDPQQFVRKFGIDPDVALDTRTRLPAVLADETFAKAAALIPDPAFALRAGECWHPSNLGTLGYAWLSSSSLRTALKRLARFSKILGQKATCRCEDAADGLHFTFDHGRGDSPISPVMADFTLALIVAMCRTNYGHTFELESVHLRRRQPEDPSPYETLFGCPVFYGMSDDSLVLAPHVADKLLLTSNQELARTFDVILAAQFDELGSSDLANRCKEYLLHELTSGEPTEERMATAMCMSRRTLQRKLNESGLTYKALLEKTRHDLALRYLDDPSKTVTDITFLLGFSEQSAFTRAFKRWSGKAPSAYRTEQGLRA
jgi:AraC-like DNA-binding protein